MIALSKDNFKQEISEGLVFVDFWGTNCQKCVQLMDDIVSLSEKYGDLVT